MFESRFYRARDNKEIVFKYDLTEEIIADIKESQQNLKIFMDIVDYYWIVKDNCMEFLNVSLVYGPGDPKSFINANRALLNTLNSFYTCQEFVKKNALNKKQKECIGSIKNSGILELANRLRNRIVHSGPVISEITYDCIRETIQYNLDINEVFPKKEIEGFNKNIKTYLNATILDTICFIKEFLRDFEKLYNDLFDSVKNEYQEWIRCLITQIPDNPPDCYNSFLVNPINSERINIGRTIELLSIKQTMLNNREEMKMSI